MDTLEKIETFEEMLLRHKRNVDEVVNAYFERDKERTERFINKLRETKDVNATRATEV